MIKDYLLSVLMLTPDIPYIKTGSLKGFNKWRVMFSLFLAKQLNKVDKNHIRILSKINSIS